MRPLQAPQCPQLPFHFIFRHSLHYLPTPSLCVVSLDEFPTNVCTLHVGWLPPQTPSVSAGALGPPPLWSAAGQGKWCVCVCVCACVRACVCDVCLTPTRGSMADNLCAVTVRHCTASLLPSNHWPPSGHNNNQLTAKFHCAIIVICRG